MSAWDEGLRQPPGQLPLSWGHSVVPGPLSGAVPGVQVWSWGRKCPSWAAQWSQGCRQSWEPPGCSMGCGGPGGPWEMPRQGYESGATQFPYTGCSGPRAQWPWRPSYGAHSVAHGGQDPPRCPILGSGPGGSPGCCYHRSVHGVGLQDLLDARPGVWLQTCWCCASCPTFLPQPACGVPFLCCPTLGDQFPC